MLVDCLDHNPLRFGWLSHKLVSFVGGCIVYAAAVHVEGGASGIGGNAASVAIKIQDGI